MRRRSLVAAVVLLLLSIGVRAPRCDFHEPAGHALFASPQVNPIALAPDGVLLFVANTTSNSVSVINTNTRTVVKTRIADSIMKMEEVT